jgi:hypothetical protein
MTEEARAAGAADFYDEVGACLEDLNAMLPELTARYGLTILVGAMAEQVGGALQALRRKKLCDDHLTGMAIERIATRAFGPHPAQVQGSEPGQGP